MREEIKQVLDAARAEIGVREVGSSNTGKRVKQYQASTSLGGTGWPWCAAFVSWCIQQGLGRDAADDVWLNSASCDMILDWARRKGILSAVPTMGACGLVMASANDATHIFFVEAINGNTLTTIEGNTNDGGSREGNGVYRRTRATSSRYRFVQWAKLLPEASSQAWELWGSQKIANVDIREGRAVVPVWKWAQWFGMELGWNVESQTVTLNGREVPAQPLLIPDKDKINRAWLGVRELAAATGFTVQAEPGKITLLR